MSVKVTKNKIQMTRGDTFLAHIELERIIDNVKQEYIPEVGDAVRFAVKHKTMNPNKTEYLDNDPLILKNIPIDTMILILNPEDTKSLGFGEYVYDIQITMADGTVDTFITEEMFLLTPEVD